MVMRVSLMPWPIRVVSMSLLPSWSYLHKVNDKVDKLVPQHLLCVEVGDEEADVVTLDLLPPQDDEVLRAAHHEAHELVAEQLLHIIRLLDRDRDPDRVDAGLDEDLGDKNH